MVKRRSSAEIAKVVILSGKSVETYRSRLMKKLDVADVPALVEFAILHRANPRFRPATPKAGVHAGLRPEALISGFRRNDEREFQ